MHPDPSIVRSTTPELSVAALVDEDTAYAMYLHVPIENKPRDLEALRQPIDKATIQVQLPMGTYRAEWMDTKTGEIQQVESFEHKEGLKQLTSPAFSVDIALRVHRQQQ